MNEEQEIACTQLFRALNRCHVVGLHGGVFDRRFAVWPKDIKPQESEDFWEEIEIHGQVLPSTMYLDGGAGI